MTLNALCVLSFSPPIAELRAGFAVGYCVRHRSREQEAATQQSSQEAICQRLWKCRDANADVTIKTAGGWQQHKWVPAHIALACLSSRAAMACLSHAVSCSTTFFDSATDMCTCECTLQLCARASTRAGGRRGCDHDGDQDDEPVLGDGTAPRPAPHAFIAIHAEACLRT